MHNIIHVNNDWYFDTINKVHIQKEGLESYIKTHLTLCGKTDITLI